MTRLGSILVALVMFTSSAQAQSHAAERSQLHDENVAAGVLYVTTILAGTWGIIGGIALVADNSAPACRDHCDTGTETAIVWSAIGAAAAAGLCFIVAVALSIDHRVRLHVLDRAELSFRF